MVYGSGHLGNAAWSHPFWHDLKLGLRQRYDTTINGLYFLTIDHDNALDSGL